MRKFNMDASLLLDLSWLLVAAVFALIWVTPNVGRDWMLGFGALTCALLSWSWARQLQTARQQAQQLQETQAELQDEVHQLLTLAHLPDSPHRTASEHLALLRQTFTQWQQREQEIRQLVTVQGLLDHELAIGNRIFFESKLQHYLTEPGEANQGALFLVQISHPELQVLAKDALQRMQGCADLIQQLACHLPFAILARLADNDLALLVPGMEQKEAEQFGDRLAVVLSRASFFAGFDDFDLVHLGYVIYQHGQTTYQVMSEADMALKTAQLQGPNAAFGFYPEQKPKIRGSVWWRTELTNALSEQRLILSFQPVFSNQQHDILQHEVLLRLITSDGDKLPAAVFLPMAANCGLSRQFDQYVLHKAARLVQQEQKNTVRCSLNISVESILQTEFIHWLEAQLSQGSLQAKQLAMELDEYHLIRQFKKLKPKLIQLQQLGFSLVIDHVGLNILNSQYINELPIDAVKLHPSIVRNIEQHLEQQLYLRGLVANYQQKNIQVIATGVESIAEWQCLQKLGISGAQGYYFSQPLAELVPQMQSSF